MNTCRYLPRMQVPMAWVGSSVAQMLPQMMGMDLWPWVPVLTDVDVSGYAIMKISIEYKSASYSAARVSNIDIA